MRIQTGGELYCLMEYIILKKTIQLKEREDYAAPDGQHIGIYQFDR